MAVSTQSSSRTVPNPMLNWDQTAKRRRLDHNLSIDEAVKIKPRGDAPLTAGQAVDFYFLTGSSCLRLLEQPIAIRYHALKKKTETVEGTAGAPDVVTTTWERFTNNPEELYISPLLGGASFIRSAEVKLDNVLVSSDTEGYQNVYQAILRRMTTRSNRRRLGVYDKIPMDVGDLTSAPVENMRFAGAAGTAEDKGFDQFLLTSYDGVFGLGPCKNVALHDLVETEGAGARKNANAILPPGCELHVRFVFHSDFLFRICHKGLSVNPYFAPEKTDANKVAFGQQELPKDVKIVITSMMLLGERIQFAAPAIGSELKLEKIWYFYDEACYSLAHVPPKAMHCSSYHTLPATCKLVYIVLMQEFQLFGDNQGRRSSDCTKFVGSKNLDRIKLRVNDRIEFYTEGVQLSTDQPTEDMLLHYQIARDRKLIDCSWAKWVAYQKSSFNNITILDLSPKNPTEAVKLTVELTFKTESLSETGLQVFLCAPRERGIMRDKSGLFSLLDP